MILKRKPYKTPWHLWVVTPVALFFYVIGGYDFINITLKNKEYLSGMYTPEGVAYFLNYPLPLLLLFGLNITAGLCGILLALFRPGLSGRLLFVSGAASALLIFITVTFMDRLRIIGPSMTGTDALVCLATFVLAFYYSRLGKAG